MKKNKKNQTTHDETTVKTKSRLFRKNKNKEMTSEEIRLEEMDENPLKNVPRFWDVISCDGFKIEDDDYAVMKDTLASKTYVRPFYIPKDGYPRKMQTNWLNMLTSSGQCDVMIDIYKVPKRDASRLLQRQETMLRSNLNFQAKRGNIDQINELKTKIADNTVLLSEIQFSENDFYDVQIAGALYANSKKELDQYTETIEDELAGSNFKIASTWARVKKGVRSILPFGINELNEFRNMDRRALSTLSPFISGNGKFNGGVPIGINKISGQLEFISTFGGAAHKPPNYNQGILGIPGSGKSLAAKTLIAREVSLQNVYTSIIDIEGEFTKLTKRLGGVNVNLSEESNVVINPFAINLTEIKIDDIEDEMDLMEEGDGREIIERDGIRYVRFVPIKEKINELLNFFDIIVRGKDQEENGLTVFERNFLEEAIKAVYEELKITSEPSSLYTDEVKEVNGFITHNQIRKREPELNEVYSFIVKKYGSEYKAERLIAALRPFLKDGSKPIFDGQTFLGKDMDTDLMNSRLVNFNISKIEEGFLRPIAYHVILNYIWEYFVKSSQNATKEKVVMADELWQFINNTQTVLFFEKLTRRARKRNTGFRWASQDFVRILENPYARGILSSTFTYFFFEQNKIDLTKIKENFNLTDGELDILFNQAPDKGEGILRVGKSSVWMRTNPSDDEMVFLESNTAALDQLIRNKKNRY